MSPFSKTPVTFIDELFIKHFRNLSEIKLSFSPAINLLVGDNGHGKTNTLEAIAIACSLKPMQSLENRDLIKCGENEAYLAAHFRGLSDTELHVHIFPQGKKARLNDKSLVSARKLTEQMPLVTFIPSELNMISGGSALRRRALDQAASALFIDHINALRAYEKLLTHRNRLLKSWPLDPAVLESFTELFIKEGAQVIYYRLKTLSELAPHFAQQSANILGGELSSLSYHCGEMSLLQQSTDDIAGHLRALHTRLASMEIIRRVSLFGPHLDNVGFYINGLNAQKCASRGQSRALVLAFKLAQMLAIFQVRGSRPIVILDDIVSELDREKKDNLIDLIANLSTQAFFSATDVQCFGGHLPYASLFSVKDGQITQV